MTIDQKMALRAARKMIDRYRDGALAEVNLRIAELKARGHCEAEELWKEIRQAVMFLTSKKDKDTQH
jgi:hypothetical protein